VEIVASDTKKAAPLESAAMTATTMNFLANDGAVTVSFTPALSTAHYDELLAIATGDFGSSKELCDRLRIKVNEWGVECRVDGCGFRSTFSRVSHA
jgi:hypothetical protein